MLFRGIWRGGEGSVVVVMMAMMMRTVTVMGWDGMGWDDGG